MINIPKGANFDFQAPDAWTGMDSIYNEGNHTNWDLEIIVIANEAGWAHFNPHYAN